VAAKAKNLQLRGCRAGAVASPTAEIRAVPGPMDSDGTLTLRAHVIDGAGTVVATLVPRYRRVGY
jgi:hypothetical protein